MEQSEQHENIVIFLLLTPFMLKSRTSKCDLKGTWIISMELVASVEKWNLKQLPVLVQQIQERNAHVYEIQLAVIPILDSFFKCLGHVKC